MVIIIVCFRLPALFLLTFRCTHSTCTDDSSNPAVTELFLVQSIAEKLKSDEVSLNNSFSWCLLFTTTWVHYKIIHSRPFSAHAQVDCFGWGHRRDERWMKEKNNRRRFFACQIKQIAFLNVWKTFCDCSFLNPIRLKADIEERAKNINRILGDNCKGRLNEDTCNENALSTSRNREGRSSEKHPSSTETLFFVQQIYPRVSQTLTFELLVDEDKIGHFPQST